MYGLWQVLNKGSYYSPSLSLPRQTALTKKLSFQTLTFHPVCIITWIMFSFPDSLNIPLDPASHSYQYTIYSTNLAYYFYSLPFYMLSLLLRKSTFLLKIQLVLPNAHQILLPYEIVVRRTSQSLLFLCATIAYTLDYN